MQVAGTHRGRSSVGIEARRYDEGIGGTRDGLLEGQDGILRVRAVLLQRVGVRILFTDVQGTGRHWPEFCFA